MDTPKIDISKLREFSLTKFAIDNGTSIFLLAFMILLFGVQAYIAMPKEKYPDAAFPQVMVTAPYFGNSASEIESLIARPIEKELKSIDGIEDITSTSIQDFVMLMAQFGTDVDIDKAVEDVKDAIDKAKVELPNDMDQDPEVREMNVSEQPVVVVNVAGPFTMDQLRNYAEFFQDEIEEIREVSKVDMKGALDREVKINVDLRKMESVQVSFTDIETAIARENMSMSAGEIVNNEFRRSIRVLGQFKDVDEISDVIIKSENERPIYIRDIAEVEYGFEERTTYARVNSLPVISLEVKKRTGENLLSCIDKIDARLEELKPRFPEELQVTKFNDLSVSTRDEVANLENSIISGVILVTMVLLFFLGLRNAAFVGIAIPLSMLIGILFLYIFEVSLNIVTLFSLILALGLLVDNAIVTVENIYRYMDEGFNGHDSAKYGASEVAMPIIASTATTLAAFLPLMFWPGIMGQFMKYFPITLICVLTSSLFVALVINPVLTANLMKIDKSAETIEAKNKSRKNILIWIMLMIAGIVVAHFIDIMWLRNLLGFALILTILNYVFLRPASFVFQQRVLPSLERGYNKFIRAVLKGARPTLVFLSTFLLLGFSIFLMTVKPPPIEFFPSADPNFVNIFVELPIGKDIEATNELLLDLEQKVTNTVEDYGLVVQDILTTIGEDTADPNTPPEPGVTPHRARLTVSFVSSKNRGEISTVNIMNELRDAVQGYAGVEISVDKDADGPPVGPPINIEFTGDEIDTIANLASRAIKLIEDSNINGIEELKPDIKIGKPELLVEIDRNAARRYGLSTAQIASTIRTSVFGKEISKFKEGEDEYAIQLRANSNYRNDINGLLNQKITFRDQARRGAIVQVPISTVADFEYSSTYSSIKRLNQQRVITVSSNILDGYNANQINEDLRLLMEDFEIPEGYKIAFTGEQESQAEEMAFLQSAFIVAIFLIFIIIVGQFNSFISPFIIILSVLFSTIGVLLGYIITGNTISVVFSGVGIIALAGIVVNNAIVLIDYINLLVQNKREEQGISNMIYMVKNDVKECIIKGGATRLRPVLLTAITTVLGLIPLAIGFNFNFRTLVTDLNPNLFIGGDNTAIWGPMAWTVIYGLVFATFLTLVIIPVMYWLAYRVKRRFLLALRRENKHDLKTEQVLDPSLEW
jgi:multidrug efflux pump subunit AcrB